MKAEKFWIKERENPQIGTYFVRMGPMSIRAAKKYENPIYGNSIMHSYDDEASYNLEIQRLKKAREIVQ